MLFLEFKPWGRFWAKKNNKIIRQYLRAVKDKSQEIFKRGMLGPHSGRIYARRGGRLHQASAPGEYPANDTGKLLASMRGRVTQIEATIGTNMYYARFLRTGTTKMARRKMSDNALREGRQASRGKLKGFVAWSKNR